MSAAVPPPPPPPAKSNQPPHYIDMPSELTLDAKNKSEQLPTRRWCKHFKPPQSPKVATPTEQPTRRSFIWPWLEGKLEKKSSSFSGEESSSFPRVSDSGPVLSPMPVCAVRGPQTKSITLSSSNDDMTNFVAVYDHFSEEWRYMDVDAYIAQFVAPSPVLAPEANPSKLESNCIDVLPSAFSLEKVTQNREEENAVHTKNKKEKLPEEENEVEENAEEELPVYIRRSEMKPKVKAVQIGAIEVQVPLMKFEKVNINPTWSTSSSENVADGTAKEEPDELPRVVEDGQGSGTSGKKKGKKNKKNKGKKK